MGAVLDVFRPEEERILAKRYDDNRMKNLLQGKNRVLVLGMGGGCDVFMAYTLAKKLSRMNNQDGTGNFLYANCISERKNGIPSDHTTLVPNALHTVPTTQRPLQKGENTYGTTFLEQSVPRGNEGSPFLLEVKGHKEVDTKKKMMEQTRENCRRIKEALDYLNIDLVFGVDCGGDSLTGGKDHAPGMIQTGRDQQVLYAFWEYRSQNENFDFVHVVLGPGCDAETKAEDMTKQVLKGPVLTGEDNMAWCKGRKWLGSFSIEDMITDCYPYVSMLEPNRTPRLMYSAMRDELEKPTIGDPDYSKTIGKDYVKLGRHGNSEVIPRKWLWHGLMFTYGYFPQENFLTKTYDAKKMKLFMRGKKKVLVLGMGGGCDVFMAYTLAKKLNKMRGNDGPGDLLYANCISERKNGIPADHITLVANALHAVPRLKKGEQPRALVPGENTYGTTYLEQSVPRGAENSPLLLEVKGHKGIETDEQMHEQTQENYSRIEQALTTLGVDLVYGVDCGGDSLTGGKDYAQGRVVTGRDQQVLSALWKYRQANPKFDFMHIVLGPGCDAESSEQSMTTEVMSGPFLMNENLMEWCSGREYLGCFPTEDMIEDCFPLVQTLEPNRTPYLMHRALCDELPKPVQGEPGYAVNKDCVKIERHGNFEVIPRQWMTHALVFLYKKE